MSLLKCFCVPILFFLLPLDHFLLAVYMGAAGKHVGHHEDKVGEDSPGHPAPAEAEVPVALGPRGHVVKDLIVIFVMLCEVFIVTFLRTCC